MKLVTSNRRQVAHASLAIFLSLIAWCASCYATVSAIVVIHQPILTAGEATVIKTPKGFAILSVPFECFPYHGHPPYAVIAQRNPLLSNAPEASRSEDSNIASMAGIKLETPFEENTVRLHLEDMKPVEAFELTASPDDIVEATIECIRRMAREAKEHPGLRISGKAGDEAKWSQWEKAFRNHDMTKPFLRPGSKQGAGKRVSSRQ